MEAMLTLMNERAFAFLSREARYVPLSGEPFDVRVKSIQEPDSGFSMGSIALADAPYRYSIQKESVPLPQNGDKLIVRNKTFCVRGYLEDREFDMNWELELELEA